MNRTITGRQKTVLERGTHPKLSRRTCEYGLQSCRGKSAGVAKRASWAISHPEIPNVPIRHFCIAAHRLTPPPPCQPQSHAETTSNELNIWTPRLTVWSGEGARSWRCAPLSTYPPPPASVTQVLEERLLRELTRDYLAMVRRDRIHIHMIEDNNQPC
jgi:hypothetical protein